MAQRQIELILMRLVASYLAMPIFIVDPEGNLLYYNEQAEHILGRRFDETGAMPVGEWSTIFHPQEKDGSPLDPSELPLVIANTEMRPAFRPFSIKSLDGAVRDIEVTAFPLVGMGDRHIGAVAVFWEPKA